VKGTVEIWAGTTTRLLVPFGTPTDTDTPDKFYCHILRHEDNGMIVQFVIVEPGETAGTPPADHDHDRTAPLQLWPSGAAATAAS
jgi:hypothetical protein